MCLQITRLKDILTAKPFDPSSAFQAFVMRPCPSSGFEPLKELPHKRLTGEGARGCSGPRSALASLQQPLAGRETVGSPSSPPPQHGAGMGCWSTGQGCPASRSSQRHPGSASCESGLVGTGGLGGHGWHERGEKGWSKAWGQGVPRAGQRDVGPALRGVTTGGCSEGPCLEHCQAVPVAEHSSMHSANHRAGPHGVARHGSALQGTCLSTTWLSAEHCGTQLAWLGTAGRDLALHNSTRCCMAQLTSAQCGLLWHGAAQLGMVLNCGHSSARHGLARHGSA